ncbi:hypothetical protein SPI_02036 [Niveomyces insectorum RCEF 264]|uniref:Uncharacterized protein n=1 Tax=Niveomyces insectorum RCEF 264 TaxID=1081102 RepID=A0A167XQ60_9HYPO|nr:hypothetical protein SPI_02036 [Niveomyces insectorum RCEF 264]
MADTADLPLALRRTRRSTAELAKAHKAAAASTPKLPKKRVRFSDPGPPLRAGTARHGRGTPAVTASSLSSPSTGLTPMIRRTSLAASSSRRRHSTPAGRPSSSSFAAAAAASPTPGTGRALTRFADMDAPAQPFSGEVTFLPLRQVLDGRVKRRLRRNGLSEEMNAAYQAKKQRIADAHAETDRLRAAVAAKDAEIQRLRQVARDDDDDRTISIHDNDDDDDNRAVSIQEDADDTIVQDTERILDLEREVGALRQQLANHAAATATSAPLPSFFTPEADRTYDWTLAARDPFEFTMDDVDVDVDVDVDTINEDDHDMAFGDATMAELQCSTPSRSAAKRRTGAHTSRPTVGEGSFPTPPATSPAAADTAFYTPATPTTVRMPPVTTPVEAASTPCRPQRSLSPTVMAVVHDAEAQAALPDPANAQLQDEVASLRREAGKLRAALDAYEALVGRLGTQLAAVAVDDHDGNADNDEDEDEDGRAEHSGHDIMGRRIELRVTHLLRALGDKTAALLQLSTSLDRLGFVPADADADVDADADNSNKGDASVVVASLAAAFRAARLELEYLAPGECTLPLTAPGAQRADAAVAAVTTLQAELARVGQLGQELLSAAAATASVGGGGGGKGGGRRTSTSPSSAAAQSRRKTPGRRLFSLRKRSSGSSLGESTGETRPRTVVRPGLLFAEPAKRGRRSSTGDDCEVHNNGNGGGDDDDDDDDGNRDGSPPSTTAGTPAKKRKRRRYDSGLGFVDEEEVDV